MQTRQRLRSAFLVFLASNNCTGLPDEIGERAVEPFRLLQSNHKKTASLLAWTIKAMIEKRGLDRVGFLTLTFGDNVQKPSDAQKRWHSLKTHD